MRAEMIKLTAVMIKLKELLIEIENEFDDTDFLYQIYYA
jgi:hypothetical protein